MSILNDINALSTAITVIGDIAKVVVPYVEGVKKGSNGDAKKELATRLVTSLYNQTPAASAYPFAEVSHLASDAIDSLVDFFHKEDNRFQKDNNTAVQ